MPSPKWRARAITVLWVVCWTTQFLENVAAGKAESPSDATTMLTVTTTSASHTGTPSSATSTTRSSPSIIIPKRNMNVVAIASGVSGGLVVFGVLLGAFYYWWRKRDKRILAEMQAQVAYRNSLNNGNRDPRHESNKFPYKPAEIPISEVTLVHNPVRDGVLAGGAWQKGIVLGDMCVSEDSLRGGISSEGKKELALISTAGPKISRML